VLRLVLISGRDTDLLWQRVPLKGVMFVGNHGLEERRHGTSRLIDAAQPFGPSLERAAVAVGTLAEVGTSGVRVERKRASVSVHFRDANDPRTVGQALEQVLRPLADRVGLRLHGGRFVWELRPAITMDKGEVLRELVRSLRPGGVIYVGDDVTDADGFAALRSMGDLPTLAVGVRSTEVPVGTFKDCDLVLDGVPEVTQLLAALLVRCP